MSREDANLNAFIKNVEEYWIQIHNGNSKEANKKERENKAMTAKWQDDNVLIDNLLPLLDHNSNAIKLSAAAYLIKTEKKEPAINTLKILMLNDNGLISPSASAVLRLNGVVV